MRPDGLEERHASFWFGHQSEVWLPNRSVAAFETEAEKAGLNIRDQYSEFQLYYVTSC